MFQKPSGGSGRFEIRVGRRQLGIEPCRNILLSSDVGPQLRDAKRTREGALPWCRCQMGLAPNIVCLAVKEGKKRAVPFFTLMERVTSPTTFPFCKFETMNVPARKSRSG